ncbi:MAG: hypothetical protein EB086_14590, partial [Rhodobacteraceae bacterium]|nr:hypothetical protein [Paracoccaceae bacterium]
AAGSKVYLKYSVAFYQYRQSSNELLLCVYQILHLSAQTALTEAINEQSCNWLVKYYAVEQEERLCRKA